MSTPNPSAQFEITPEMQPDREGGTARLTMLARASLEACGKVVVVELERSRQGFYGDELKEAASGSIGSDQQSAAIKVYTAAFMYLMAIDFVPNSPPWLKDFLLSSLGSLDRLVQGEPLREILIAFSGLMGYDVIPEAAAETCRILGLQKVRAQFSPFLEEFLHQSGKLRAELLEYCLLEDIEVINKHVQELYS